MKRVVCLFFVFLFVLLICGCDNKKTESKIISQEITIVKMPSPPKCKTTDSNAVVNEVLDVLAQIKKSSLIDEKVNGGWEYMFKLNIDGETFIYTVGTIFTDADGKQYNVENYEVIKEKIEEIYDDMNVTEVDYP